MIRKRLASGVLAFGLVAGAYLPIAAATTGTAEASTRPVGYGARGSQVVYVQRLLGVRQTGYFGNETRAAVIHLQRKYHLRVTGSVDQATALTPGIESPTVSPLHREGWVAVQAMVLRDDAHMIMDKLYDLGARAILVTDIANCRL